MVAHDSYTSSPCLRRVSDGALFLASMTRRTSAGMPDGSCFSLAFSRALGKVVVHVHGALDADTAPALKARLVDIIDDRGNRQVVLDLQTTGVDAAGLLVLADALKRMDDYGGSLVLSGRQARQLETGPFAGSPSGGPPAQPVVHEVERRGRTRFGLPEPCPRCSDTLDWKPNPRRREWSHHNSFGSAGTRRGPARRRLESQSHPASVWTSCAAWSPGQWRRHWATQSPSGS